MKRNLQQAALAGLAALILLATGCETLHSTSFAEMPIDHGTGGGDGSAGNAGSSS